MVIIFYDANDEKYYIATENEKMQYVSANDPNLINYIPNDDILYVEDAHFVTKHQFHDWLNGDMELESHDKTEVSRFQGFLDVQGPGHKPVKKPQIHNQFFIHPVHNGTLLIQDIKTKKYPHGITLSGKWHFLSIDDIGGEDILEESMHFRTLLAQGKIEVVDAEYVKKNIHKCKQKTSPSEAALNAILVPADIKAEAAAEAGGMSESDIPEMLILGD